jgi:hypothetical protein
MIRPLGLFQSRIYFLMLWTGDRPDAKIAEIDPCLEWDSNPRSQCPSGRRQYVLQTARPLGPAGLLLISSEIPSSLLLSNELYPAVFWSSYRILKCDEKRDTVLHQPERMPLSSLFSHKMLIWLSDLQATYARELHVPWSLLRRVYLRTWSLGITESVIFTDV